MILAILHHILRQGLNTYASVFSVGLMPDSRGPGLFAGLHRLRPAQHGDDLPSAIGPPQGRAKPTSAHYCVGPSRSVFMFLLFVHGRSSPVRAWA